MIDKTLEVLHEKGVRGIMLDRFLELEFDVKDIKDVYAFRDLIVDKGIAKVDQHLTARILPFGSEIQDIGGWLKYIDLQEAEAKRQRDKEDLDFKKSKVDFKLAKKMLKDFPTTQKQARWGLIIAGVVGLVQIIQIIVSLLSNGSSD